jgi:ABC-type glycerol-3-phosphate transport system substrate-binding protein
MNEKRKLTRRKFLKGAAGACIALIALGGLAFLGSKPGHAQVETLRVNAPPWIFKKFPLEEAARRFEADHPNVKVELTRVSKWPGPIYIASWRAGETPTDLHIQGMGANIGPMQAGGWLEPLDDLFYGHMAKDKFVQGFLKDGHYKRPDGEGTYYPAIPFMGEVAIVAANTRMFKEAGLWENGKPVPMPSWEESEFFDYFGKLAAVGPTGKAHIQIWDREFQMYNYNGPVKAMRGSFISSEGPWFDHESDELKKWLHFVQKMDRLGYAAYVDSDEEGYSKWKTQIAATAYFAQGHAMELVSVTGNEEDLAYLGWPGADKNGSIIWTHSVFVPKLSDKKDLAKTFIREQVFSAFFQQWSFNHYGKLPILKEYYGEGITWFADQMPLILAIADNSEPIPVYADIDKYLDVLQLYLPDIAHNRLDVAKGLAKIKADLAELDFTDYYAKGAP